MPLFVHMHLLLLLLPRATQDGDVPETFDQAYARGEAALEARRLDESLEAFLECIEVRQISPGAAYDIACIHALRGEIDAAFTWLERAMFEWSYPAEENMLDDFSSDAMLDPLRADPRFAGILERFSARVEREQRLPIPDVYIDWIGGHSGGIWTGSFSPDGKWIVTGSTDRSARVWSASSGEPLLVLKGHFNAVTSAAFTKDGERILTGGWDGGLRLWDSRIGLPLRSWKNPPSSFRKCVFSPDERWVLCAGHAGFVGLADAATDELVRRFVGHSEQVNDAAYSPDGLHVATAARDQTARIWDPRTGEVVHVLVGHRGYVWGVAFSPDGSRLLTTGADGTARIWSVASGACERLIQVADELRKCSFSPDGRRIAAGCIDGRARIWSSESGALELELALDPLERERAMLTATFSGDGARILTTGSDGSARLWNASTGEEEVLLAGRSAIQRMVGFSPDGTRLVTLDDSGAREWDAASLSELAPAGRPAEVHAAAQGESAASFQALSRNPQSYSWDPAVARAAIELEGLATEPVAVFLSPGGDRVYTIGRDHSARLWDVDSGKPIADLGPLSAEFRLTSNSDRAGSASFSSDGAQLVTTQHPDGVTRLWDARTGSERFALRDSDEPTFSAAFSPTGDRVVVVDARGCLIWDVRTGAKLARLIGHRMGVIHAVFSPDGERVASVGIDHTIRLWNAATGECLQILRDVVGSMTCVAFSPDGLHLAATHRDHRVALWDLRRARLLGTLVPGARGEWLAYAPSMHYHGSPGGIGGARLVIGGVSFSLACFGSILESEEAVRASLAGEERERARVPLPPTLLISAPAEAAATTSEREVRIQARAVDSLAGIERIEVVQDGVSVPADVLAAALTLEDNERLARLDLSLPFPAGANTTEITLQAVNTRGIQSRPEHLVVRYEPPKRELFVLALGVADYDDDALDLRYPVRDVDDLIARLQAQVGELYHEVHVERRVDREVTSAEALGLRDEFLLRAKPDDTILVFAAGHGVRSASDEYWFLTSSATPAKPYSGIDRHVLESLVTWDKLHAARRVLLIDTCHAGAAFEGTRAERGIAPFRQDEVDAALEGSSGLYIFAATSDDAFAREQEGNGIFTRAILDGLEGAADQGSFGDQDGYVGVSELMQFARYAVLEKSAGRQVPTFPRIEGGENFPLVRVRAAGGAPR